ncbi:hypothetical protein QR680_016642 [Steinernema hermaphroditum]|uniref:Uncharacterized protein n=1 Tax=Steinernema hermaphroditum TaxID=289476 RepID=A0AA39HBU4_9BILA|nr:hypothetical protein QR680_016642 [Steinernema hermaphroditum]
MASRLFSLWLLLLLISRVSSNDVQYIREIEAGTGEKEYLILATKDDKLSFKLNIDLAECRNYVSRVCLCYKTPNMNSKIMNFFDCPRDEAVCLWIDNLDKFPSSIPMYFGACHVHRVNQFDLRHWTKDLFSLKAIHVQLNARSNRIHIDRLDDELPVEDEQNPSKFGRYASPVSRYDVFDPWCNDTVGVYRVRFISLPWHCPAKFELLNSRVVDLRNVSVHRGDASRTWEIMSYKQYQDKNLGQSTTPKEITSYKQYPDKNLVQSTTPKLENTTMTASSMTMEPDERLQKEEAVAEVELTHLFIPITVICAFTTVTFAYGTIGMSMWKRWCCFGRIDSNQRCHGVADDTFYRYFTLITVFYVLCNAALLLPTILTYGFIMVK